MVEEGVSSTMVGTPECGGEAKKEGGGGVSECAGAGGKEEGGMGGPGVGEGRVCLCQVARELRLMGESGEGVGWVMVPSLGDKGNHLVVEEGVWVGGEGGVIRGRVMSGDGGIGWARGSGGVGWRGCGERGEYCMNIVEHHEVLCKNE